MISTSSILFLLGECKDRGSWRVCRTQTQNTSTMLSLAKELGEDIGYRRVETLAMTAKGGVGKTRKRRLAELPESG